MCELAVVLKIPMVWNDFACVLGNYVFSPGPPREAGRGVLGNSLSVTDIKSAYILSLPKLYFIYFFWKGVIGYAQTNPG